MKEQRTFQPTGITSVLCELPEPISLVLRSIYGFFIFIIAGISLYVIMQFLILNLLYDNVMNALTTGDSAGTVKTIRNGLLSIINLLSFVLAIFVAYHSAKCGDNFKRLVDKLEEQ